MWEAPTCYDSKMSMGRMQRKIHRYAQQHRTRENRRGFPCRVRLRPHLQVCDDASALLVQIRAAIKPSEQALMPCRQDRMGSVTVERFGGQEVLTLTDYGLCGGESLSNTSLRHTKANSEEVGGLDSNYFPVLFHLHIEAATVFHPVLDPSSLPIQVGATLEIPEIDVAS